MTGIYAVDLGIVVLGIAAVSTVASLISRRGWSLWRIPKDF